MSPSSPYGSRSSPAPSAGRAPRASDREERVRGIQLAIPPFVACMVLVAMLSYLGLHVIAREVIFVDLSLAQMAALGGLTALLVHVAPDSGTAYLFALLATALGAFVFALTRTSGAKGRVPQEAFIGIVYVVASGAAILVANKVPGGGEAIEKTLTGSILWVTWPTIAKLAVAYAALGVFHYMLRHKFLTISFHPEEAERAGWKIRWWDFWFYLSFGVVITLAVPVAAGPQSASDVESHATAACAGFPPPDCALCHFPTAPLALRRPTTPRVSSSSDRIRRRAEPARLPHARSRPHP